MWLSAISTTWGERPPRTTVEVSGEQFLVKVGLEVIEVVRRSDDDFFERAPLIVRAHGDKTPVVHVGSLPQRAGALASDRSAQAVPSCHLAPSSTTGMA